MKPLNYLPYFLLFIFTSISFSQETFYYDPSGKEYKITSNTSKEIMEKYLEQNDLNTIEFNPEKESNFPFRVETKNGNWLLCNGIHSEFIDSKPFTIQFPSIELEKLGVTIVQKGKKKFIHSLEANHTVEHLWFDEMKTIAIPDSIYNIEKDQYETFDRYLFALKQKKKWALVFISRSFDEYQPVVRITPMTYNSYNSLPIEITKKYLLEDDEFKMYDVPYIFMHLEELYQYKDIQAIEFNENFGPYPARVKTKKGDWLLIDNEGELYGKEGYALELNTLDCGPYTTAKHKNSTYICSIGDEGMIIQEEFPFDDIKEHQSWYTEEVIDPVTGMYVLDSILLCDYLMIKRDDQWALAFYDNSSYTVCQLSGFHFEQPKDLPDSILSSFIESMNGMYDTKYNSEVMQVAHQILQKNDDIDVLFYVGLFYLESYGEQPVFKVRNKNSKRWSYHLFNEKPSSSQLPMNANNIKEYERGNEIGLIEVWRDDLVGYYYYDGENIKQIMECKYDDFEYVFLDSSYGCALKSDGKWELYKIDSPEKMINGSADSVDELIELWLNR